MTTIPRTLDTVLSNGMRVIAREVHDAPVATFWIWYRAGARNEMPGITGVSHWVEHMQFKGTQNIGKGEIFAEISRNGGYNNALTSNDWTAYFETLPSERIALAIRIEADRMANSRFDPEEVESERTVILSEQQGAENSPGYLLYKEVAASAFRIHPYGRMVVGLEHDLRSMTRDDLYDYYRLAYSPTNAYVVAVGDFDAEELLTRVERAFGGIEAGRPMHSVRAVEPPQVGERRIRIERPAPTSYGRFGFHTPASSHPDTAAILVADAVLSGAKGMGIAGGGPMGRSARLYRSLVASGLARAADSDFDFTIDPYLLMIGVTALPGIEPERIEAIVNGELKRLATEPVESTELARAIKQLKAQYVYSAEGVSNQAFWLGQMELLNDYHRADTMIEELESVTSDDVQRVAQTYLTPENRTVGWFVPAGDGSGSPEAESNMLGAVRMWGIGGPQGSGSKARPRAPFERHVLSNGIVLIGQAQPDAPSIVLRFRIGAGAANDPAGYSGTAALTARTLSRGTADKTFEQINEVTDGLGASLSVDASQISIELRLKLLREDLPDLIDLVSQLVQQPAFPSTEVDKARNEMLAAIKEQDNDTRSVADRTVRELIYPDGHPLHDRVLGKPESVQSLDVDHLREFHGRWFGPGNLTVAAVGGFDSLDSIAKELERAFATWISDATPQALDLSTEVPSNRQRIEKQIAGKTQADVAIGFPIRSRLHPNYYALEMANLILGRLGLMGRLGANVRDKQGLAYYAFSIIEPGRANSLWLARAGVDPSNVDRAITGVLDELTRLRDELVTDQEIDDAKRYTTGIFPLALESNDGIAGLLLSIEHFGLGLDYVDRYPTLIESVTQEAMLEAVRSQLNPSALQIGIALPRT